MRAQRIIACCLGAFVVCMSGAAGASAALPEVGRCEAKAGGKYSEGACLTKAMPLGSGSFEWIKGAVKPTFATSSGAATLETTAGTKVECASSTGAGKYDQDSGAITEVESVVVSFKECVLPALKASCNSAGGAAGEIVTNTLQGPLGFIAKANAEVGQELTPTLKKGAFAEFECAGGAVKVVVKEGAGKGTNCVIADVNPVNLMTTNVTWYFDGAAGVQSPPAFESKKPPVCNLEASVNGGAAERASLDTKATVTYEEALEIKASTKPVPKWWVEGAPLKPGEKEAIAETTTVPVPFELEMKGKDLSGGPFTIRCGKVRVKNGAIEGPNVRSEEAVVYEECIAVGKTAECIVEPTETSKLKAALEGPNGAIKLKFKPQSGTAIAAYFVKDVPGKTCLQKGEYKASGEMVCDYKLVELEALDHALEFTATSGSTVKVEEAGEPNGPQSAGFKGTDEVHLESGKDWSAL